MKCDCCGRNFEESAIQESHDVPCYLFEGNRKGQKNQADKLGRHQLCESCHKEYENKLRVYLVWVAKHFSLRYWNDIINEDELIEEIIESELEGIELREFFLKKLNEGDDGKKQ